MATDRSKKKWQPRTCMQGSTVLKEIEVRTNPIEVSYIGNVSFSNLFYLFVFRLQTRYPRNLMGIINVRHHVSTSYVFPYVSITVPYFSIWFNMIPYIFLYFSMFHVFSYIFPDVPPKKTLVHPGSFKARRAAATASQNSSMPMEPEPSESRARKKRLSSDWRAVGSAGDRSPGPFPAMGGSRDRWMV